MKSSTAAAIFLLVTAIPTFSFGQTGVEQAAKEEAPETASTAARVEIVISVPDQKLALVENGVTIKKYPISTSRFGLGDSLGSYKTPLGRLKICQKLGDGLPEGAVFKKRNPTGEVLAANAPGRDPIVTRIMWLDGQEPGNANARERGIYIHGTPVEKLIGRPVSFGCIRMRSHDVVEMYNLVAVGTEVKITMDKLQRPRFSLSELLLADSRRVGRDVASLP